MCFRYLNQFIDSGELDGTKSKNLLVRARCYLLFAELMHSGFTQNECKKIKGFSGAAQKVNATPRTCYRELF